MKSLPFTRPTIVAAIEFLGEILSQAKFDQLIIRLGVEQYVPLGSIKSVTAKSALLGSTIIQHGFKIISTLDGSITLAETVVREAVLICMERDATFLQQRFLRGLSLDGYVIDFKLNKGYPTLRSALPNEINLPSTDDEVHDLLKYFNFNVPLGHLNQAIEAHTRGDWAAANSQIRTFMEGLLDSITFNIDAEKSSQLGSSENRRAWLAERQFLSMVRYEWTKDGKNFINGIFKMLHTEGPHPGLSDEDHSTFRLHLCLITSRTFLRRLKNNC